MKALALNAQSNLVSGTVQSREADMLLVAGPFGLVRAVRAEGCLLQPEIRDTVLLALLDNGDAWVISVLRRADPQQTGEIRLPDNARLHSQQLHLEASNLHLAGRSIRMQAGLLSLGGRVLLQGFSIVQTVCRHLGERVLRRAGQYSALEEHVQDLAHRTAGRVRSETRTSYRLRAERADIRAAEQVDIDGRHIKIG